MKHTADIKLDTQCLAVTKRGAMGYIYNDSPTGVIFSHPPFKTLIRIFKMDL